MSQITDLMKHEVEDAMAQIKQYEANLRKKEATTIGKIESERKLMDKFTQRRDFYEKMQANMGPGRAEASSKLDAAKQDVGVVQAKVKSLETTKAELEANLDKVLLENKLTVLPELERLGQILEASRDELDIASRAYQDDEERLKGLAELKAKMDFQEQDLQQTITDKESELAKLLGEPQMHAKKMTTLKQDREAVQDEIDSVERSKHELQKEIKLQNQRRADIEQQKIKEINKLHHEQKKLDEKRICGEGHAKELDESNIYQHSLASQRIEIELHTKKAQEEIKHNRTFLTAEHRQLKFAKSALVKKQQATAQLKTSVPELKSKLQTLEQTASIIEAEKKEHEQTISTLKNKVDACLMKLFDEEYVEDSVLGELDATMRKVAEKEYHIEQKRSEEKRASALISIMKEKRAITRRKIEQAEQVKQDIDVAIHVEAELQKLDLEKQIKDAKIRAKDFSFLNETLSEEKKECMTLIGQTKKALHEMKSRREALQVELRAKTLERDEKMKTLQEEIDARTAAQHLRANKRTDKSKSWSEYRMAIEEVERQEAHIDKLKASLSNAQRGVELATSSVEHLNGVKRAMRERLHERKHELSRLYENSVAVGEALKKGELGIQRLLGERKMAALKNNDIQRSIEILRRDLSNPDELQQAISDVTKKLEAQVLETEKMSQELENPSRFAFDSGDVPSEEELGARLAVLDRLVQNKKEILLAKEMSSKEIALRIQQLEETSNQWKKSTKSLLQDTNEYQGRVHEVKRIYTAQMSELRLYDELISANKKKMADLKNDMSIREQLMVKEDDSNQVKKVDKQVSSSTEASQSPITRQRFERPTAYIPNTDDENTLKVPRPYGASAPFKPWKPGAMMRHIRKPSKMELF